MLEQIKGFHIEPTNICTLKCPECARTQFINKFSGRWSNQQLDLEHLKSFIDIDIVGKEFTLCGNYGDPIYYNQLIELATWLKQQGAKITIITNGSYKTREWWAQLCSVLTLDDQILFAIDGLPESFTQYRINADWASIRVGIQEAVKHTKAVWKFIPFSFNEHEIDRAKRLSVELGMHSFVLDPSDRWNTENISTKPTNFDGPRTEHVINWVPSIKNEISPRCLQTHTEHFISANGYYTPCCYAADHRFYYSSDFYKNKTLYNIETTTISKVLENLSTFFSTLTEDKFKYCTFNCPKI